MRLVRLITAIRAKLGWRPGALALLAAVTVAAFSLPGVTTKAETPADNPPIAASMLSAPGAPRDYVIGPLDKLSIKVFQVPDLSLQGVPVDASGHIELPLIGTVVAAGQTTDGLSKEIAGLLEAHYLQSPQVSVFVDESASRKITIQGEVKSSGVFQMKGRLTLLQALAMAGGLADNANVKRIAVIRDVGGVRQVAYCDYVAIRSARAPDPEVVGDDVIIVEGSQSKMAWSAVLKALPLFSLLAITA